MIFIKRPEIHTGKKKKAGSSTNGAGQTGWLPVEESKIHIHHLSKIQVQWIKDLNIKPGTLTLIEEKVNAMH